MHGYLLRCFSLGCGAVLCLSLRVQDHADAFMSAKQEPVCQERNTRPRVKIEEPTDNSIYPANTLVSYTISVSDKEDGESRYDEIPSDKIFLEVTIVKNDVKSGGIPDGAGEQKALTMMMRSDCFSCHEFKSRNIGPAFTDIAMRYQSNEHAGVLAMHIMKGSKGIWGEQDMPAHPDFSEEAAREIAEWILTAGRVENLDYVRGKTGTFRTTLPPDERRGSFILKAIYTDEGSPGTEDFLTGHDSIIVHSR